MTTMTVVTTPPTEAEIREAITEGLPPVGQPDEILMHLDAPEWMTDAMDPLTDSDQAHIRGGWAEGFWPQEDHPGTLWADLTKAEIDELHAAIENVYRRALAAAVRELIEGGVAVGLAFAAAHPDVPRGRWQSKKAAAA